MYSLCTAHNIMNIYQVNVKKYRKVILELQQITKRLSLLRGVLFIVAIIVIIVLANERLIILLLLAALLSVLAFSLILFKYNKGVRQLKTYILLEKINENELLKVENKLSTFPSQENSLIENHSNASDLDIFGSHSLFQLLDRTTTESGGLHLANWLLAPALKETILERQQAVQELKPNLEWRQQMQAAGLSFENKNSDYQKLIRWFETDEKLLNEHSKYLIGSALLALLSTTLISLYLISFFSGILNFYLLPLFIVLLINHLILKRIAPLAIEIIDHTDRNVSTLAGYEVLIQTILSKNYQSTRLEKLRSNLIKNQSSATKEIGRLKKILAAFQLRGTKRSIGNAFYGFLNQVWLLDIYWIILAEKWKSRNRDHIRNWIEAVSEFEALNSLAGFAYSNPSFAFPEITDEPYRLQFEMLGHPLIKSDQRVCNDFTLDKQGQIAMITGSNMAGKSTFLRAVGVNLVLALMGAPCCAKSGRVSQIKVFTSMRTKDNIEEGVSSFYAELKRVEQLLKLIKTDQPIFFMLDELFKGTNSKDRYKGGVSLIKQLSDLNAFGIISTHDLELARLAGNYLMVSNHSFNSEIHDGEMSFNYELTDGICTDFNASELMKKSGIVVLDDIERMNE